MENPYITQFPDLMSGKKIMYVHGFLSSAQSGTVKMLQELMPNATLVAEDIPVHPEEAVEMLQNMVKTENPDLIIGTSMGGMFTEMLKGYDRILVNPAFEMGNTMSSMTGKQTFQNPRKDGIQELMVTKGLIKEYRDITQPKNKAGYMVSLATKTPWYIHSIFSMSIILTQYVSMASIALSTKWHFITYHLSSAG